MSWLSFQIAMSRFRRGCEIPYCVQLSLCRKDYWWHWRQHPSLRNSETSRDKNGPGAVRSNAGIVQVQEYALWMCKTQMARQVFPSQRCISLISGQVCQWRWLIYDCRQANRTVIGKELQVWMQEREACRMHRTEIPNEWRTSLCWGAQGKYTFLLTRCIDGVVDAIGRKKHNHWIVYAVRLHSLEVCLSEFVVSTVNSCELVARSEYTFALCTNITPGFLS